MNIHIITIGDEILIGQIVDTNSAWMGQQLNLSGFRVTAIKTVGDELEAITGNIRTSIKDADVILLTGGLGATKDDITKKAIAEFLGVGMYFDQDVYDRICYFFNKLGRKPNEAHRLQSYMPETVQLLTNKMGTAPGMWFEHEGKILVSMPGVPYEMKYLMGAEVIPRLKSKFGTKAIVHHTIITAGHGETALALRIEKIESSLPEGVKIAYLPNLGTVRIRVSAYGNGNETEEELNDKVGAVVDEIKKELGDAVFGEGEDNLSLSLGRMLLERNMTMATAESCTGGNIAARIVQNPGSSAYFKGGVVAYSNALKMGSLNVKESTLRANGAVSEATVREMVQGAVGNLGVDLAIAVSGIAGPGGGTPDKPVGTIWLAVGDKEQVRTRLLKLGKDRLKNIEYTTKQALNMARLFVLHPSKNKENILE